MRQWVRTYAKIKSWLGDFINNFLKFFYAGGRGGKFMMGGEGGGAESEEVVSAREKLKEAEKLMAELNMTWEDKLKKTEAIQKER